MLDTNFLESSTTSLLQAEWHAKEHPFPLATVTLTSGGWRSSRAIDVEEAGGTRVLRGCGPVYFRGYVTALDKPIRGLVTSKYITALLGTVSHMLPLPDKTSASTRRSPEGSCSRAPSRRRMSLLITRAESLQRRAQL